MMSATARSFALVLAVSIAALAIQFLLVPIDGDVSWLITVSERVLSGQRLYVDVFEVNPPASVWLYLPQVALAQWLGLRPESVIVLLTTAAAAASAIVTGRMLSRLDQAPPLALLAAIGFVLLILPGGLYAQREHVALILSLPVAASLALIADKRPQSRLALLLAGLAAGMVIVIKPHFIFAMILPAIYALGITRNWRPFLIAGAAAAAIVVAYGTAIMLLTPQYLAAIPMLTEIYGPMREQSARLLAGTAVVVPIALVALAWVLRPRSFTTFSWIVTLMIAGFTIAVLIQGKGYWNHALPGIGLGLVLIAWSVLAPQQTPERRRLGAGVLAVLGLCLLLAMLTIQPPSGLVAALQRVAPERPRIITLGTELTTGHPAVRLVDGEWVGSRAALYTAAGVRYRTSNRTRNVTPALERWYREDLDLFAEDVARGRPDVVLVERKSGQWLLRDPVIRAAMRDYRPVARAGRIEIWLRRL